MIISYYNFFLLLQQNLTINIHFERPHWHEPTDGDFIKSRFTGADVPDSQWSSFSVQL